MVTLGFDEAIIEISSLIENGAMFIGIGGGTGSGKTYLSKIIAEKTGAVIIKTDDYYKGREYVEKNLKGNYDHPDGVDLKLLSKNIEELKSGNSTKKPIYSMEISERTGYETIEPQKCFLIEGIFALNDIVAPFLDLKVYMNTSETVMLERRIERDLAEGRRGVSDSRTKYFKDVVLPMHEKFVIPTKKNADIIIENN